MNDATPPPAIEFVRAWRGRLELLGEHLTRLCGPVADRADDDARAAFAEELVRHHQATGARDGCFELRGGAARPLRFEPLREPRWDGERLAEGLALLHAGERPPLPPVKSSTRAAHADALLAQARTHGADELLWIGDDGALLGATTMNLFLLRGATLRTPSVASGAWPGLLRRAVLLAARELAGELGLDVREERLTTADLAAADDAFLAGSAHGIVAIRSLDGRELAAPPRGSPARAIVPKLKLRVHERCSARFLPTE